MRKVLTQKFFERPTTKVARDLLGKYLVRSGERGELSCMITEVEAYDGFFDKASHASKGRTLRNEPMWNKAGVWYVYLIYGMYDMLNIVTREEGYPAAVLIRGATGISGPGKLTKQLAINRTLNNKTARKASGLWIEDRGMRVSRADTVVLPRIGVLYAGEKWAKKPWRFLLSASDVKVR